MIEFFNLATTSTEIVVCSAIAPADIVRMKQDAVISSHAAWLTSELPHHAEEWLCVMTSMAIYLSDGAETDLLLRRFCSREQLGPTNIGGGFAVPHAKTQNSQKLKIGFARFADHLSYKWGTWSDGTEIEPAVFMFVFVIPVREPRAYLAAGERVSSLRRDEEAVAKLRTGSDIQVCELLERLLGRLGPS